VELFDPNQTERYAAVVYSKRYNLDSYREAEALQKLGVCIVLDLCDNHFYNPTGSEPLSNAEDQLRRMMSLADEITVSTEAMAEVVRSELWAPKPITVIRDPVETEIKGLSKRFWKRWRDKLRLAKLVHCLKVEKRSGRTPLVWFGIHGGPNAEHGMLELLRIKPLLEKMNGRFPLSLTVISNSKKKFEQHIRSWSIPTRYLRWQPESFLPALRAHSISIIPISKNPFTNCKTNNRLATALYAGLAVVADSIPSYRAFAETCYLDDWERGLESYLSDPALRRRHVDEGRAIIDREWTLACAAGEWQNFFDRLLAKKTPPIESFLIGMYPPFKGFRDFMKEIKFVDRLTDFDLLELNHILRWNCFVIDGHGRRFGNPASDRKRSEPQVIPDSRVLLMHERFDLANKHVLEFGCFEGVHTIGLSNYARKVTAVDARIENVVKTIVRCGFFGCHPTVFKCDVEERPLDVGLLSADLAFHVGVLYHLRDPVQHLIELGRFISEGLLMDTHYSLDDEATESYQLNGRTYRYKLYREGGVSDVFSGMHEHSKWLRLDDIVELLSGAGFKNVDVVETRMERNGPRVLLIARRGIRE
jgi:tRNA (mo5U34)-methyltransferase